MEEQEIIQLLFTRAEGAIDALEEVYGPRLYQTAMNVLDNPQDAEEAVSDTYLAVWNAIPPKKPESLAGFVLKTGRNIALNLLRSATAKKRNSRFDVPLEELEGVLSGADLEDHLDARELGRAINAFLGTVSADNRRLFLRRYWFGDPVKELAREWGVSADVISVRLSRLRGKLKEYLIKEGLFDEREDSGSHERN